MFAIHGCLSIGVNGGTVGDQVTSNSDTTVEPHN